MAGPRSSAGRAGATASRSLESLSLAVAVVAAIGCALVALPVFRLASAPIAGEGSVAQYAAIASAAVAALSFLAGRVVVRVPGTRWGVRDAVDLAALAFAVAVIALLTWTLVGVILDRGFIGAEVFALATLVLSGAAGALTGYVAFAVATHLDLELLAVVLAVFLVLGILASMLTASDPDWWKDNLSALGINDDLSSKTFNLTLIVAGVIVTTLARFASRGIVTPHPRGVAGVRTCLVVVGIFLGLVGVFPVNEFFAVHTAVASGMVVAFGVLIFRVHRWVPGMARPFVWLGFAFLAWIVLLAVLFVVGVYTLTAVELVAGVLVFTWIILFIRNVAAVRADTRADAAPPR